MIDPIQITLIEDHKTYGKRLERALNRLDGIAFPQRFAAFEADDKIFRDIYEKLQVNTRSGAVAKAVKEGIV
jgi:hypothetical protein